MLLKEILIPANEIFNESFDDIKCTLKRIVQYLELSFLMVLAFPNASKSGFDYNGEKQVSDSISCSID